MARGTPVSGTSRSSEPPSEVRLARAALTYLAEPGDPALGALLAVCDPAEVLAAIKADTLPEVSQIASAGQLGSADQISSVHQTGSVDKLGSVYQVSLVDQG